jgi:hypothetical protein
LKFSKSGGIHPPNFLHRHNALAAVTLLDFIDSAHEVGNASIITLGHHSVVHSGTATIKLTNPLCGNSRMATFGNLAINQILVCHVSSTAVTIDPEHNRRSRPRRRSPL